MDPRQQLAGLRSLCSLFRRHMTSQVTLGTYVTPTASDTTLPLDFVNLFSSVVPPLSHATDIDTNFVNSVEATLTSQVIPGLCVVGLAGNAVTLFLLAAHIIRRKLGRMEKFAAFGLAVLAATDVMFCLTTVPMKFVDIHLLFYDFVSLHLIYLTYHNALVNIFIAISSWTTATLALARYMAVCHPLWARHFFGPTVATRTFISVVVIGVLMNIPRFFMFQVESLCPGLYLSYFGWLSYHPDVAIVYWWMYAFYGALVPFALLAFANVSRRPKHFRSNHQ